MATYHTIDGLIRRLEDIHVEISDGVSELTGSKRDERSPLQIAQSDCIDQIELLRRSVHRRDELFAQGKNRSVDGIAAAAAVRRDLNELAMKAEKLEKIHANSYKGSDSEMSHEVHAILKNIDICIKREKEAGSTSVKKSTKDEKLFHSLHHGPNSRVDSNTRIEIDDSLRERLIHVNQRDEELDGSLDSIAAGLQRLRAIATDIHNEVRVQAVMIDEIAIKADNAENQLTNMNRKMHNVLKQAGGASRFFINIILSFILLSLALFIFQALRNASGT
ncbi:Qc-snare [Guillardia theta CCMP2712]|uniref:Qc-snare n=1 Tax=Guillardia theta (strain CCMP2712) TaxID=905079 RepID=L1IIC2_GUITC|nr:Qc-snare [Guillardia theta CCMP2712]EKX35565.1 Qc-snare [Guillardia theta CCMP2712]|mmetsp:Transcript_22680/g.74195  ORF Transcript_22680/g.74195 Transcript_22680/m.74195 type:complete len:277 (-) Transcript_22680:84-914(-)|eukprot:XP_005822545.1 Qc-snare [Guillardia theta CCMP2712]